MVGVVGAFGFSSQNLEEGRLQVESFCKRSVATFSIAMYFLINMSRASLLNGVWNTNCISNNVEGK